MRRLDVKTHVIAVTYLRSPNLPRVVYLSPPDPAGVKSRGLFAAAPTAQAADVYFSGKITAAGSAKPRFSFEAKVQNDWDLGGHRGQAGYRAEAAADEGTNADPDRLKVDFDMAVNDLVSLTLQHRWGYLPPTYKKVSPTLTLSLTFKGQWL